MTLNKFNLFLKNLGFTKNLPKDKNEFTYNIDFQNNLDVVFVYTPNKEEIFQNHVNFWNENRYNNFIAVGNDETYIINAKAKPNQENPIAANIKIASFNYGINSESFEKEKLKEISKEYIDSAYFFDFVIKNQKRKQEVDKDLLLNLIALRNKLLNKTNENVIHNLILRCLFVKYLEDRKIYDENFLLTNLQSGNPKRLIKVFDEIAKINGDVFKDDRLTENEIKSTYLKELAFFFQGDYRNESFSFFPYRFDKIPIELISNVYESFLKSEDKKGRGIYYTPNFVVKFMLSHTLKEKLKTKNNATVLDPAVGSGAFLVESFKAIINGRRIHFDKKTEILKKQLFGIDIDQRALQIAAFSLYLALLETEDSEFIRDKVEKSHPILPSLIGTNLIHANSLTDEIPQFQNKKFDCIICNPPWGSVEPNSDQENIKEREAILTKGKYGKMPEYVNVSNYERSQAFLIRIRQWGNENTIFSLIVKNSIFLNDNSEDFRKELLQTYHINYFYELSNYNRILFEKKTIEIIGKEKIEIGASEPCVILIFNIQPKSQNIVKYISPKLDRFSEYYNFINFTQKDIVSISQQKFIEDDSLWKIFVNGDSESYYLITKLNLQNNTKTVCRSGFQPLKNEFATKSPNYKKLITPKNFQRYRVISELQKFDWNQKLRRKPEIFFGNRIIFARRPLNKDELRLNAVRIQEDDIIYKDDILSVTFESKFITTNEYKYFLGILNSKLIGYVLFHISAQWGKGEEKRAAIRNEDIETLPLKLTKGNNRLKVIRIVNELENEGDITKILALEEKLDKIIFDIYKLTEYEKEIIREFYQTNVERTEKNSVVRDTDIEKYIEKFASLFENMLVDNTKLYTSYKISPNVGAIVCFRLTNDKEFQKPIINNSLQILNFVKRQQLKEADISKILNEDKVKIYDDKSLYVIKSNLFKDWTIRQAIKDANEELSQLLSKLPDNDE